MNHMITLLLLFTLDASPRPGDAAADAAVPASGGNGPVSRASQERDVFGYDAQKAAPKDVKKIVLIGAAGTHGAARHHELVAGSLILARRLHAAYPNVHAVIYSSKNSPKDLSHADVV